MREERAFKDVDADEIRTESSPIESDNVRLRTEKMRQMASSLFHKLSESVEAMIHDQKAAGAAVVSDVARAGFHAAEDLDASAPDAARALRKASAGVEHLAENLRTEDLGQIFGSLRDFGRSQPLAFVGGAVVGGFLIARSARSGRLTGALRTAAARASNLAPTAGAS